MNTDWGKRLPNFRFSVVSLCPPTLLSSAEEREVFQTAKMAKNYKENVNGFARHTPAAISSKGKTYLASMGVVLLFLYSWKTIT